MNNDLKIILISGKARHGKDTFAEMLYNRLTEHGHRVLVAHYADLVKYVCKTFFEWDGNKDSAGRTLLQYVGTDVVRTQEPNYWVDFILSILKLFGDNWDFVLIPDARFPNEIDRMMESGFDVSHVRVYRPNYDSGLTEEQLNHPSETALDNYKYDCLVVNQGDLSYLEDQARLVVDLLRAFRNLNEAPQEVIEGV